MIEKKSVKNPIIIQFAKRVRLRRHDLGLTQEQLAELSEFSVAYIGGIERGVRNPSLTSIFKLAKALNLKPGDLIS
jgi:transcriptional regulator with XRE-family HTH domain